METNWLGLIARLQRQKLSPVWREIKRFYHWTLVGPWEYSQHQLTSPPYYTPCNDFVDSIVYFVFFPPLMVEKNKQTGKPFVFPPICSNIDWHLFTNRKTIRYIGCTFLLRNLHGKYRRRLDSYVFSNRLNLNRVKAQVNWEERCLFCFWICHCIWKEVNFYDIRQQYRLRVFLIRVESNFF